MITDVLAAVGAAFTACMTALLLALAGATVIRAARKHRTGGQPAPGAGQHPAPGTPPGGQAAHPPERPHPAPGHLEAVILHYTSGRREYYDGEWRLVATVHARPPRDWDAGMEELRP